MTHKRITAGTMVLLVVMVLLVLMCLLVTYEIYLWYCGDNSESEMIFSALESEEEAEETTVFSVLQEPADSLIRSGAGEKQEEILTAEGITVVLDPGHGLGEPGCTSELMEGTEAEVVLEITMMLKERLEEQGITVCLTHDGSAYPSAAELLQLAEQYGLSFQADRVIEDDYYSPYERTLYASILNETYGTDLFLSLHINSLPESPEVSQYELYYCAENPEKPTLESLTEALKEVLERETKIEASGYDEAFITTKYVTFPALLIEMGYSTNPQDAADLNALAWRQTFCDNLTSVILSWASGAAMK